jgi:hypothetical protein
MKARSDINFPSHNTFNRFGGKSGLAIALKTYCENNNRYNLVEYYESLINTEIEQRTSNSIIDEN